MAIEHIRLSQQAKEQLIKLKRTTGIQHWNVLCRSRLLLRDCLKKPAGARFNSVGQRPTKLIQIIRSPERAR
ncbi:MAG: DndE family protein [Pyrinomonadaceae bacterium]